MLPALAALTHPSARLVALVKPQFEVGKGEVGKGGVVREAAMNPGNEPPAVNVTVFKDGQQRGYRIYPGRNRSQFNKLGLLPGDLITAIDGEAVASPENVGDAIRDSNPGDAIRLTVVRAGSEISIDAVLGSRQA